MKLDGIQILLVEDCPDQQRMLLHILENEGASVYLECDGFAAVRTVRKSIRNHRPFDAVIMDLVLEASDGINSTISILELKRDIPVVAITAHGSEHIEREWRQAGCLDYMQKPLNAQQLVNAVVRAIALSTQSTGGDTMATPQTDTRLLETTSVTLSVGCVADA
jgi:DNA-binding NtrC family response regulator